ncbi:MAG: hypothetical protein GWN18_20465, partial [Thermoplasmata archaeon]|nr:hypothetical protein [Thermoplasmata archaeon]NIT80240.1 hypothetical protein [Thermoplasmata archaeon]NIU51353.1 hypothetical protein [Thermoplasmata archaeon]NIV81071.1 hypothetical protein [Thermoplasmata archaeon]NIW84876.1 hypothetical protein [Thermoplasmata archaeon]
MHVGHSAKTEPEWQEVLDTNMAWVTGHWQVDYLVPSNATSVDFTFFDGAALWDGKDWRATVEGSTNFHFIMDGYLDSDHYVVHPDGMRIAAAVKDGNLYLGTWSTEGSDVFLWVSDALGDASTPSPGWNKQGTVFLDTATVPHLAAEADNKWASWVNMSGPLFNGDRNPPEENALEGELNLVDAFGTVPDAVYVAVGAYQTWDG